jgi:serine/threonine protein phosphatase 1
MRTLAIGDIHGCHTALTALLEQVQPQPTDRVIFLGDYVDRGPASRAVIESLIDLSNACSTVFLRGNHEDMMLDARKEIGNLRLWQGCGGAETLLSYGAANGQNWIEAIPAAHWKFLERTQSYFESEEHIFVHGCVDPELAMEEQSDWLMYWENFERIQPHRSGKRIICGHTPQRAGQINNVGFAACVDTGAVYGGWLSCLEANSGEYWQANEKAKTRAGKLEP